MKRRGGVALLAAVSATAGVVVACGANEATPAARESPANTVKVEKGQLSALVSVHGTLTYRARVDGSPYSVINQAHGVYTKLPASGAKVGCGDVLYRVNQRPVLLLCGTVPAYRKLDRGDAGEDVRQLNRNLHVRGARFTGDTENALEPLQRRTGAHVTGALDKGDAVFLPEPVRIARVTGELGGSARPGAPVAQATSDRLEVRVDLDASQQGQVKIGDRARITLPGNRSVKGKVHRLGRVAQTAGKDGAVAAATIAAYIRLDRPKTARGLDRAPVQTEITTRGVENALSVPVTALVGKSGGGFAVEVVRAGGRRELVAVELGLFDTGNGRVQVDGDLDQGDPVVVPAP